MTSTSQTLSDRMATGRIPVAEALRIATLLADQLRQLHEQGAVHGALTPAAVAIDGPAVELLPAGTPDAAYAAPEVLAGKPADLRSDIYSFGGVLLEMLTGRPTFDRPTGSPAVDRLMNGCMAKAPEARFQRVQKLMLELRMLTTATRRSAPAPAPAAAPSDLEQRIAARLAEQEKSVASVAQVANEVLKALQQQQQHQLAAPAPEPPRPIRSRAYVEPMDDHSAYRLEKSLDALADKVARIDLLVGTAVERLKKLEETFDAFDTDAAALRDSVTRDIRNFERALKAQNTAIESARTAMGQTDDLVERVVEALDALQSMFVTTADERSIAS
jgi:hypothetical protein